jgi:hypothetical protein
VQLRATLWDGFVGSNVGFFADRLSYQDLYGVTAAFSCPTALALRELSRKAST